MNHVSRTSGVRTVGCPSPNNGVTHARLQVDGLDSDPKGNKFLYVLGGGDSAPQGACLGIVLKLLLNRPVFHNIQYLGNQRITLDIDALEQKTTERMKYGRLLKSFR